jgi:hypothetical protein
MKFINEFKIYESRFNLEKYDEVIYLQIPALFLYSFDSRVFKTGIAIKSAKKI